MTLDLKELQKQKAASTAAFELKKKEALAHDKVIVERQKAKDACLEEMSKLQGEYRALDRLEKSIAPKAVLPANRADRRRKK